MMTEQHLQSVESNSGNYGEYVSQEQASNFNLQFLWYLLVRYKYWILASIIVCLAVAHVYIRYQTPMYSISTKILIKEQERRPAASSISTTLNEMGFKNSSNGFDNELEVLSTRTLNKEVVRNLKLYVAYYVDGRMRPHEIYGKYAPYLVDIDAYELDSLSSVIKMELANNDSGVEAIVHYVKNGDPCVLTKPLLHFPATINTEVGRITVEKNPLLLTMDIDDPFNLTRPFTVYIYPLDRMASAYTSRITVAPSSKTTTIAQINMVDNIPERGRDYLQQLAYVYNEDANKDNTEEAKRTAKFIDERLALISKELGQTESELQKYKQDAGIVDAKSDAQIDMSQKLDYENRLVDVTTQLNLLEYISEYVNLPANHLQIIPSNIGLQQSALISVITQYNQLVSERNNLLRSASESNPAVIQLTTAAEDMLMNIKGSLISARRQLSIQRNDLQSQYNKHSSNISSAPSRERAIGDISRQQEVKAGLYLMLLQKREENAITLASAAYKGKMIEEPLAVNRPISPKKSIIYLVAFVLGLVIPFAYYYLRQFFRYRIVDKEDLTRLTSTPLLGTVPYVKALTKGDRTVVIQENRNSVMMEVYRTLRSNLPFILKNGQKVLLFTSASSGEGKTTIVSNLAASIAFVGKKVVIVGLDIRKPRLAGLFDLPDTERGMSNFLSHDVNDVSYIDMLIQPSGISPNLDILPAGPIPPNPAELLERENLQVAIDYLKTKYDYVLLDTAPIGLVSDTLSIAPFADASLFIVRANYTLKADVALINTFARDGRLPNVNLIFNAVKEDTGKGGRYSYGRYGYRRTYGYGYGDGDKLDEI